MAAATEERKKKESNPEAEAKNWEQRLRSEQEAIHQWNEAWGDCFKGEIPNDPKERVRYLENKLKTMPSVQPPPRYGVGKGFKEFALGDHRRKKMFCDNFDVDLDEAQNDTVKM